MLDKLVVNTVVHLRFFARNRLLLGFGLLMGAILLISLVPMLIFDTSSSHFAQLQGLSEEVRGFALVFTASLGLFAVAAHVRGRSVKLVLTKPCPPGIWLASIFASAGIIAFGLYTLVALSGLVLSLVWKIPLQWGLLFTSVDGFLQAIVWFSFVTMLTMAVHPVIVVMVVIFLNDGIFYQLQYLIESARVANGGRPWLTAAGVLCDMFYALLPMAHPFSDRTQPVFASWRVRPADWLALGEVGGYALLSLAFFYALSLYLLRRKDLI